MGILNRICSWASFAKHRDNHLNPHSVTAEQVGAYRMEDADRAISAAVEAERRRAEDSEGENASEIAAIARYLASLDTAHGYTVDHLDTVHNNLDSHTYNFSNPHKVTAGQVGAYTREEVDAKVSSVYRYRGSAASYDSLPSSDLIVGDVYNVSDTGANYAWDGTAWDKLSETVDLTPYALKTELTAHTGSTSNPHGVTAAHVGAYTKAEVDNKVSAHTKLKNNPHGVTADQICALAISSVHVRVPCPASLSPIWPEEGGGFPYMGIRYLPDEYGGYSLYFNASAVKGYVLTFDILGYRQDSVDHVAPDGFASQFNYHVTGYKIDFSYDDLYIVSGVGNSLSFIFSTIDVSQYASFRIGIYPPGGETYSQLFLSHPMLETRF